MKKVLGCALALVMLTACSSGGEAKKETKTCTASESGMEMSVTATGTDDVIEKVDMEITVPGSLTGITEELAKNLSDEDLKKAGDTYMKGMGLGEGSGVEATFKMSGADMVMTMSVDLKDGNKDALSTMGIDGDQSLSDFVKNLESSGGTCK